MDRDQLNKGAVFNETSEAKDSGVSEAKFDLVKHLNGMHRDFWDIKQEDVAFKTFRAPLYWTRKATSTLFQASKQLASFEEVLRVCSGEGGCSWKDYAGHTFCITSDPSDHMAKCVAAVISNILQNKNEVALIRWVDVNQRDRYNKHFSPRWDKTETPDLVVMTGLHANPTPELWESVRRWQEYTSRFGVCIMVGSGANPVDMSARWFGIESQFFYMGFGASKRAKNVKTAG